MSSKERISRRKILLTMVMAVAVPATLKLRNHHSSERSLQSPTGPIDHVLQMFAATASAVVLGRLYLNRYPEEDSLDALVLHLRLQTRNEGFADHDAELGALHEHIRSQVRRDFESGNCVQIDGWVLSRTEARACALATLT
jgi:hypothetical protein